MGSTSRSARTDYSRGVAITSVAQFDAVTHVEPVRFPPGSSFMRLLGAPIISGGGAAARLRQTVTEFLCRHRFRRSDARLLPASDLLFEDELIAVRAVALDHKIPSLAFAVGVYLPLSSSTPIFAGGMIRWLVDWFRRRELKRRGTAVSAEQLAAESDKSPGVLMASGYIAGGAIAGIVIAFMAGVLMGLDEKLTRWAGAHNPFFAGPWSDLLSLLPFLVLVALLWRVAAGRWLSASADRA
jgi:hypothetical protein